jgi:hypothetical protein
MVAAKTQVRELHQNSSDEKEAQPQGIDDKRASPNGGLTPPIIRMDRLVCHNVIMISTAPTSVVPDSNYLQV